MLLYYLKWFNFIIIIIIIVHYYTFYYNLLTLYKLFHFGKRNDSKSSLVFHLNPSQSSKMASSSCFSISASCLFVCLFVYQGLHTLAGLGRDGVWTAGWWCTRTLCSSGWPALCPGWALRCSQMSLVHRACQLFH